MRISPPDLNSRRARFADWLELIAMTSYAGQASLSLLRSLIRKSADDRMAARDLDIDAEPEDEPEVTDRVSDDLEDRVFEELAHRAKTIGSAYPFTVISKGKLGESQIISRKDTWVQLGTGELIYIFCLLDSGMRDDLISLSKNEQRFSQQIGLIFQICSCLAVGGYTGAEVVSFGFPRATGDGFLPALQAAWKRYGSYSVRADIPHGFDAKLKDGGIDIIAWRSFDDGAAATFLMFVQVASGLDWKNKPVANDVKTIKHWFVDGVFEHFTPAICIPFPLWFDLDEPSKSKSGLKQPFQNGIFTQFVYRESTFGVIFDRGRIAKCSALALSQPASAGSVIDGLDKVNEVITWVTGVLEELAEKRSAA